MFYFAKNTHCKVEPLTKELLDESLNSPVTSTLVEVYRKSLNNFDAIENPTADDRASFEDQKNRTKGYLPIITPHATFSSSRRINSEAIPNNFVMLDYDHLTDPPLSVWQRYVDEGMKYGDLLALAYITPSGKGLRLIFRFPMILDSYNEKDLAAVQSKVASEIGLLAYDKSCKDFARCSYLVSSKDVLHRNDRLIFSDFKALKKKIVKKPTNIDFETTERSRELISRLGRFVNDWVSATGGDIEEGTRNTRLFSLSCQLLLLYPLTDRIAVVKSLLPDCGLSESEIDQIVHNADKQPLKSLSTISKQIMSALDGEDYEHMPIAPLRFPGLLRTLISPLPKEYHIPASLALFPALGVLLDDTSFVYLDNCPHEASFMHVLFGSSSSGKSCCDGPCNVILKDVVKRDEEARSMLRNWKDANLGLSLTKDKTPRPVVPIQIVSADMTSAGLLRYAKNAEPRRLYAKLNELTMLDKLSDKFNVICNSFDYGNRWGATRATDAAVDETVTLRFNWLANATPAVARSWFKNGVHNGVCNRISFSMLPTQVIGSPIPVYGKFDSIYERQVEPYLQNLKRCRQVVEDEYTRKLAERIVEYACDIALMKQNEFYWSFSHRSALIAWLRGMVLYVSEGFQYSTTIEEYAIWSYTYDMYMKTLLFRSMYEKNLAFDEEPVVIKSPLDLCSVEFGLEEYRKAAQLVGQQTSIRNIKAALRMLVLRNKLRPVGVERWQKIGALPGK